MGTSAHIHVLNLLVLSRYTTFEVASFLRCGAMVRVQMPFYKFCKDLEFSVLSILDNSVSDILLEAELKGSAQLPQCPTPANAEAIPSAMS